MVTILGSLLANVVGEWAKAKILQQPVPDKPGKGVVQSKTMWGGAVLAMAPFITGWLGITETELAQVVQGLNLVIGSLLVWWGRKTAEREMGVANG